MHLQLIGEALNKFWKSLEAFGKLLEFFKSVRKTVQGIRKSCSNFASKTFEALREVVRILFAAWKIEA